MAKHHAQIGPLSEFPLGMRMGPGMGAANPIQVNIDVMGIQELQKYWRNLPAQMRRAAGWGAWYAAYRVYEAADDTVPHRTGLTQESAHHKKDTHNFEGSSVGFYYVAYDTEYAWKIHESTWFNFAQPGERRWPADHDVPPSKRGWRGAKWLEKALEEVRPLFEDIVGGHIRSMLDEQAKKSAQAGVAQGMAGGKRPPMLVKKGTSSGGATKPVEIYMPPPLPGDADGGVEAVYASAINANWAKATGAHRGDE